jgi:hypothetical protein
MSGGFLDRWSRLKSESKAEAETPASATTPEPESEAAQPAATEAEAAPPPDLPPVESLTKESDFSAFLQAGVPEDVRRAALSKLWASDPMFTQPEVFDLHMEDYNLHPLGEAVRTAWKVGRGIAEELTSATETAFFTDDQENLQINTDQGKEDTADS